MIDVPTSLLFRGCFNASSRSITCASSSRDRSFPAVKSSDSLLTLLLTHLPHASEVMIIRPERLGLFQSMDSPCSLLLKQIRSLSFNFLRMHLQLVVIGSWSTTLSHFRFKIHICVMQFLHSSVQLLDLLLGFALSRLLFLRCRLLHFSPALLFTLPDGELLCLLVTFHRPIWRFHNSAKLRDARDDLGHIFVLLTMFLLSCPPEYEHR